MPFSANLINYRAWKILVSNNTFVCCPPGGEPIAVDRFYASPALTVAAAKTFVDRMILREQICEHLDLLQESGRLHAAECDRIEQLVGALVKSTVLDHAEFDRTPLQPHLENPSDSSPESPA